RRADLGGLLGERLRIGEKCDPRVCRHAEVVPALAADVEGGLELVVTVVRAAARTGVRVLLGCGCALDLLDPDVDPGFTHARTDVKPGSTSGSSRSREIGRAHV